MPVYDDTAEYAVGTTGTTLNANNGIRRRWSEQVAAAFRALGLLDTMVDGAVAPVDQTILWLDTNTDPAVLKYYEPLVTDWVQVTQDWLRSADFSAHITNTNNPHSVTAEQLGVPAVDENATISGDRTYTGSLDYSAVANTSTIRADLGLAIGSNVQAHDTNLDSLAGLTLAQGDILYATAVDTLAKLAKGTAGQALVMNSGATAPEWGSAGAIDKIATATISNDAVIDFTFDATKYRNYHFVLENVLPASDNVGLLIRTSSDGGSTFDDGPSDYLWTGYFTGGGSPATFGDDNDFHVRVCGTQNIGTAAGEYGVSGDLWVYRPAASTNTRVIGQFFMTTNGGANRGINLFGQRSSTAAVNALRFFSEGGNTASGTITMYAERL